jgi:hypothetical protein
MPNQIRQDVTVDLDDLTPEERKRFIDLQLRILKHTLNFYRKT